jgi:hypothetical protein
MKAFLATWRNVQDTIVRHPFCRYTILPAGIVLAIWLVAVPAIAWNWWREGLPLNLVSLTDDYVVRLDQDGIYSSMMVSIGLVGWLLTGRWLPTLVALVYMLWPISVYDQSGELRGIAGPSAIFWMMALAPVLVWMRVMDRRLEPVSEDSPPAFWFWAQPLDPRMRKLAWWATGFCLMQILLLFFVKNCWLQNGMLQALLAGVIFAVVVDITWRISPGPFGCGILGGSTVGLYAFVLVIPVSLALLQASIETSMAIGTCIALLAGIRGYRLASRPGRDNAQTKP